VKTTPRKFEFLGKCKEAQEKQIAIEQDDTDHLSRFKEIVAHEGPPSIAWEDGSTTTEPLHIIEADDPVASAMYAKRNGLLVKPGWKP